MKLVTHLRKICNHSNARLVVCSAQFSVPTGPVNFLRPLNVKWETGNDNPILARNSCPGNLWSQFPIGKNHLPLNCRGMASSICSKLALLENFWTFIALRQIGATCLQSEILPRPLSKFASFWTLWAIRVLGATFYQRNEEERTRNSLPFRKWLSKTRSLATSRPAEHKLKTKISPIGKLQSFPIPTPHSDRICCRVAAARLFLLQTNREQFGNFCEFLSEDCSKMVQCNQSRSTGSFVACSLSSCGSMCINAVCKNRIIVCVAFRAFVAKFPFPFWATDLSCHTWRKLHLEATTGI